MPHPVLDAADRFKRQVLANEQTAANRLTQAYTRAYARLGNSIAALEERIAAEGGSLSRTDARQLAALRSLQQQTVDEINRFSVYADTEISNAASNMIQLGGAHSRGLVAAHFPNGPAQRAIVARFDMLPVESIETMLGFLSDASPLRSALVGRLGPLVAQRMGDALVDGIATGMNPREVARLVRRELGVGLTWALNTARTAQLWSYREATRANYMANGDIVGGWTWYAEIGSPRTCMSCIAKHGTRHAVDEVLNDHHGGRCTAIPTLQPAIAKRFGLTEPTVETGEAWFARQPEATQRARMGPSMFAAWKAGAIEFGQLSAPYEDAVYGTMVREATLEGLLGERAREFYVR